MASEVPAQRCDEIQKQSITGTLAGCQASQPTPPLVSLLLVTEMSNLENFLPASHVEQPVMRSQAVKWGGVALGRKNVQLLSFPLFPPFCLELFNWLEPVAKDGTDVLSLQLLKPLS